MKITNFVIAGALFVGFLAPTIAEAQRQGGQGQGQGQQRQGQGQGQGQGRGQGGQQGQRGMMGSMGGFVTSLNLVQRADVQTDLKLTADQKAQVEKLQEEQRESMRSRFGGGGGAGAGGNRTGGGAGAGGNRTGGGGGAGAGGADVRAQFEALQKAQDEAVNKILTPEQQTRLKQINVQMRGTRVLLDAEFQKELGLDRTQIRTIEDLQEGQQQANAQVFQRVRNGELDNSELQGIVDRNNKILDEELLKVLTEEQKAKLKELQGPEFKRDPKVDEEIRNRGFRPGGN